MLKNILQLAQKEVFYYQRFDACLHFAHFIPTAELTKDPRKPFKDSLRILFFQNDTLDFYFRLKDFQKMTEKILELSKKDPNLGRTFMDKWAEDELIFNKKCEELEKLSFGRLGNNELIQEYMDFKNKYLNRLTSTSIIDGFVLYYDKQIAAKINREIKGVKEKEMVFSKFIAPTFESFIASSEIFLLTIAYEIQRNKKLSEGFKNVNKRKISELLNKNKDIKDLISKYIKRFFWIRNNINSGRKITTDEVIDELKIILSQDNDLNQRKEFLLKTPSINKEIKLKLFEDLKISKDLRKILNISDDFALWQDMRKKAIMISSYYFTKIFKEITKRLPPVISTVSNPDRSIGEEKRSSDTYFSIDDLKYTFPSELEKIFKMQKKELIDLKNKAEERRKLSAVIYYNDEYEVITDPKRIVELKKTIIKEQDYSNVKNIKGLSANSGKVIGKVNIIKSVKELDKFKSGQILVSVMTRPDYLSAIRKASGIVTDEGGITSHAAVIAREFNIPCIVGTKIATRVLKDGDLVEVDGDKGEVRIKNL